MFVNLTVHNSTAAKLHLLDAKGFHCTARCTSVTMPGISKLEDSMTVCGCNSAPCLHTWHHESYQRLLVWPQANAVHEPSSLFDEAEIHTFSQGVREDGALQVGGSGRQFARGSIAILLQSLISLGCHGHHVVHHYMVYGYDPACVVRSVTEDLCSTCRGCMRGVMLPDFR